MYGCLKGLLEYMPVTVCHNFPFNTLFYLNIKSQCLICIEKLLIHFKGFSETRKPVQTTVSRVGKKKKMNMNKE